MAFISEHPLGATGERQLWVRKHQLPNGLNIILCADPSAPMIAYQTWFHVGSRHEFAGKSGLAHLFEHLMFNESEHLARGEFDRRLEAMGANTNAATWLDWTYYHENIPCDALEEVMRLEVDRFSHLVLAKPQVASELHVVASERRAHVDDDVDGFLAEQLYALAFTRHPYRAPTIGWMDDILGMNCQDALGFYRTYYAPNNATLVIVGNFVESSVLNLVEHHYGGLPAQVIPEEKLVIEPEQTSARRASFVKDVAADRLLVGWPGCGLGHADIAALDVALELLAGGPSSRLQRRLVIEEELTANVDMELPKLRDPGLIELRLNLERGREAAEAEAIIAEELRLFTGNGPSAAELERALNRLETGYWRALRHPEGQAFSLGHYDTTVGDYRRLFQIAEEIKAVTPGELQRVMRHYFAPQRSSTVSATPRGA